MGFSILKGIFSTEQAIEKYPKRAMQIFRMFLISQIFSCAGIQVILIITKDHLNNNISSNFIFRIEIEEQFDRSSKVVWWSD